VGINERAKLTIQIPKLLKQMSLCNWNGEVYSTSDIFQEKFAGCLNFLLTWLNSIITQPQRENQTQVNVTALQMKDALKWLVSALKRIGIGSGGDLTRVDNMIAKL
jgi:hypothetical protein